MLGACSASAVLAFMFPCCPYVPPGAPHSKPSWQRWDRTRWNTPSTTALVESDLGMGLLHPCEALSGGTRPLRLYSGRYPSDLALYFFSLILNSSSSLSSLVNILAVGSLDKGGDFFLCTVQGGNFLIVGKQNRNCKQK